MEKIEYEEIGLLKQSEKSTVLLVRETGGERVYVKKILKGRLPVYSALSGCPHPFLPALYEVRVSDRETVVIEEYIEGQPLAMAQLTGKQWLRAIRELCTVLEFLHGNGIIHRDIKPSNLLLASDGHIRLIDFDAARLKKENLEQDTRLLGTRGYAPPEQYGFAQTDERADLYALGVTMEQLLGKLACKPRYRRVIRKCTNLNPDKRYRSAGQVKRVLSFRWQAALSGCVALLLLACVWGALPRPALTQLPAPENPRWEGESGLAVWGNVPESGGGIAAYHLRIYRQDTKTPPDPDDNTYYGCDMQGNGPLDDNHLETYQMNLSFSMMKNGYYYFAVSADGDGEHYSDSPFAFSDAFEFTGENAPALPAPEGLEWKAVDSKMGTEHYAVWSNLDDYADQDTFNVCVYDKAGDYVANNMWTKEFIDSLGKGGVWLSPDLFEQSGAYRFTVQALTSRPNEFRSSPMPDPAPEEFYSPWYLPAEE